MRAVVLTEYGGPEVLTMQDVPDPVPGRDEVLVDITATALNRADVLQRLGRYPGPPTDHEIPGLEFCGVVDSVGVDVRQWSPGDEVMGLVGGGGYAEKIVTKDRALLAVPQSVPLADAAAIPEVWITAFDALVAQAGLTSGRTALVHAGASGVGTASIQIAKAIGARIAVTCSTAKMDACRDLGADLVIDYTQADFAQAVGEWTDGAGVDIVLDVIGGDYFSRNVSCLALKGTLIQVGTMVSPKVEANLGAFMVKRARLIGTVLRARPIEEKLAIIQRFGAELLPLFDQGIVKPVIDRRFAFADIGDAHRHMEANANVGKILVDVA